MCLKTRFWLGHTGLGLRFRLRFQPASRGFSKVGNHILASKAFPLRLRLWESLAISFISNSTMWRSLNFWYTMSREKQKKKKPKKETSVLFKAKHSSSFGECHKILIAFNLWRMEAGEGWKETIAIDCSSDYKGTALAVFSKLLWISGVSLWLQSSNMPLQMSLSFLQGTVFLKDMRN